MKIKFAFFALIFSAGAFAAPTGKKPASVTNPSKALVCTAEYKANKGTVWNTVNRDQHWILTDERKVTLKNDFGAGPAIALEALAERGKDAYRLTVTYKGVELLSVKAPWTSMQFLVPVDYQTDGAEDPPHFDWLRVSCDPSYAAG